MPSVKGFARGLLSQSCKFALFFAAVSTAVVVVFGSSQPFKTGLKDSGIYEKVVDGVLDQTKDAKENQDGDLPLNDPAIKAAIKDALPPEFIEQTANGAIDSLFAWLEGKTAKPQVTLDLSEVRQKIAAGIGQTAFSRANGLPVCTSAQLRTLDLNNIDIFALPCRPPNVDARAEQAKLVNQLISSSDFIEDTTATTNDSPKENSQDTFDRLSFVPTVYQWLVRLPWILGGIALVSGAGLILLHDDCRRGIWVLGRTLLATGVVLIIGMLLLNFLTKQIHVQQGDALQTAIPDVVRGFTNDIGRIFIIFGVVYAVVGGATMLIIRLTRPKLPPQPAETPTNKPETAVTNTETTVKPTEQPTDIPKS